MLNVVSPFKFNLLSPFHFKYLIGENLHRFNRQTPRPIIQILFWSSTWPSRSSSFVCEEVLSKRRIKPKWELETDNQHAAIYINAFNNLAQSCCLSLIEYLTQINMDRHFINYYSSSNIVIKRLKEINNSQLY